MFYETELKNNLSFILQSRNSTKCWDASYDVEGLDVFLECEHFSVAACSQTPHSSEQKKNKKNIVLYMYS